MRKSEILTLKWDDVDLRHDLITVRNTKNGEPRRIAINGTLRETLSNIMRRLDVAYVFFDCATGKPYGNVMKSFSTACRRSGITDFHFHDLRHTFASQLVMAGVDLTTIKELMGHKTMAMTLRYSHLAPKHMAAALEILDQVLNENSTA
jgi:integrase